MLGLRLIKETVNFDDPSSYHFYYGDDAGHPGTILTFFPVVTSARGHRGTGMVEATTFAVPENSLERWMGRLTEHAIEFEGPFERFSDPIIAFRDPDGLDLEIAAYGLPSEADAPDAIRGLEAVTLCVDVGTSVFAVDRYPSGFALALANSPRSQACGTISQRG